jgi:hypothetical protein
MASLLEGDRVSVEMKVECGTNWVEAVRRSLQSDDMVVCFAEQRAGLLQRPLSQILRSNIHATIYILSGLSSQPSAPPDRRSPILAWVGSLAIMALALLLQIRITSLPQDWVQTTLLILSALAEVWLIAIWNGMSG